MVALEISNAWLFDQSFKQIFFLPLFHNLISFMYMLFKYVSADVVTAENGQVCVCNYFIEMVTSCTSFNTHMPTCTHTHMHTCTHALAHTQLNVSGNVFFENMVSYSQHDVANNFGHLRKAVDKTM